MKASLLLGLIVSVSASSAIAQTTPDTTQTTWTGTATPVYELTTGSAERATTATDQLSTNTRATTAAISQYFTEDRFEERWEKEKSMYEEAGISEDKITRLRELNQETWNARAAGERINFQELNRKQSEILSPEDMQKLREVRRSAIRESMDQRGNAAGTTATQVAPQ